MSQSHESAPINWPRLAVCGLLSGFAWTLLSMGLLTLIGRDFLLAVGGGRLNTAAPHMHLLLFLINLACGVWALWLCVAIRRRFGSTRKSAGVAGLGWWVISSLQSFKWVTISEIPVKDVLLPFVATLPAMTLAILVGMWFYEESGQASQGA